MPSHQEELVETIVRSLELLDRSDPCTDVLFSYLYKPHPRIDEFLSTLAEYASKVRPSRKERQRAGILMEEIAVAAFSQMKGVSTIKSYQSAAPQYDLLVSGDTLDWSVMTKKLYMADGQRGMIVEAKARSGKLTDKEFLRMIGIMETHLSTAGLGVFFTIKGATGFPTPGASQRGLRDCQVHQALYYAKTEKPIVVFDMADIAMLNKVGALPRLIVQKVRALSELCGLAIEPMALPLETMLPPHLLSLIKGK